jgi:hypothetical protein
MQDKEHGVEGYGRRDVVPISMQDDLSMFGISAVLATACCAQEL